jgi:hypothetical protein
VYLVLFVDSEGLVRIDIVAGLDEHEAAHQFWHAIQPLAEHFDATVRQLRSHNASHREESQTEQGNPAQRDRGSKSTIRS